jgi:hypothetical protein
LSDLYLKELPILDDHFDGGAVLESEAEGVVDIDDLLEFDCEVIFIGTSTNIHRDRGTDWDRRNRDSPGDEGLRSTVSRTSPEKDRIFIWDLCEEFIGFQWGQELLPTHDRERQRDREKETVRNDQCDGTGGMQRERESTYGVWYGLLLCSELRIRSADLFHAHAIHLLLIFCILRTMNLVDDLHEGSCARELLHHTIGISTKWAAGGLLADLHDLLC